ncbi:MAG TPA: ethanolamine ammonia-lyase subunit EutC [Caulobacteraceae bacterium]|nr:ethanolamine ammonia-lyase subunit EutC [Caulobacteraceae bacterium]
MSRPPVRTPIPVDVWARLRSATDARIGLGRSGEALPTRAMLDLQYAHALARDAVHEPLAVESILRALDGLPTVVVESQAGDRHTYLTRPDLGRRLALADGERLTATGADLAITLGDGLSAGAVAESGPPLVHALLARLPSWTPAPIVVARQARVALGDEIGARLGVQVVVMLIGERPGLSAPASLGAYITWNPAVGRLDAERNCVSNIRPAGLGIDEAAGRIAWLVDAARRLRLTGVGLKDAYPEEVVRLEPPPRDRDLGA